MKYMYKGIEITLEQFKTLYELGIEGASANPEIGVDVDIADCLEKVRVYCTKDTEEEDISEDYTKDIESLSADEDDYIEVGEGASSVSESMLERFTNYKAKTTDCEDMEVS